MGQAEDMVEKMRRKVADRTIGSHEVVRSRPGSGSRVQEPPIGRTGVI